MFFFFFLLKDKFFPNERRREAREHEVTRLISVVTLVCSHTTFFYFLVLFFEPSCWVTVFFVPFFFTCIFNSLCNFSNYKFGRAIFNDSLSLTKKKTAKR